MTFATPLTWWMVLLGLTVVGGSLALTWRGSAGLPAGRRAALLGLRALAWALLVFCLLRPVALLPPTHASDALVAIVVDASRSMPRR